MGTERFGFRDNKTNTIYLFYRNGRAIQLKWSTKINVISRKHWDKRNQKIREGRNELGAFSKNTELQKIIRFFKDINPDSKTRIELKKLLDDKFRNKEPIELKPLDVKMELFEYFKSVVDNQINKGTKSSYKNSYNHLKRYNDKLKFDDIDLNFYDNYTRYLKSLKTGFNGKPLNDGYKPNTIASSLKVLKTIMNYAYKRSLHSNRNYSLKEFKVEFEEGEHIFLTDEQIDNIIKLKLDQPDMIDTRKYFIIGCYAGLRISDVLRVDKSFFNKKNNMISVVPFKGDKSTNRNRTIMIPVNSKIKNAIADGLPKIKFKNYKYNKNIKQLCKLAGIANYSEVTSHTCRRSFATNALNAHVKLGDISYLMGHSSTRVTADYLKLPNTDRAKLIQNENIFLR